MTSNLSLGTGLNLDYPKLDVHQKNLSYLTHACSTIYKWIYFNHSCHAATLIDKIYMSMQTTTKTVTLVCGLRWFR